MHLVFIYLYIYIFFLRLTNTAGRRITCAAPIPGHWYTTIAVTPSRPNSGNNLRRNDGTRTGNAAVVVFGPGNNASRVCTITIIIQCIAAIQDVEKVWKCHHYDKVAKGLTITYTKSKVILPRKIFQIKHGPKLARRNQILEQLYRL